MTDALLISDQAKAEFDQAQILKDNGQTKQAIEKFKQAAQQWNNANNEAMSASALHMTGVCHLMERDYDQAIPTLQKAADLFQRATSEAQHPVLRNSQHRVLNTSEVAVQANIGLGNAYRDLGLAFFYRKQYDQARHWLDLSASTLGKIGDKAALGITLGKSALLFKKLHQWDKSALLFKQALTLIREQGHWFYEATVLIDWSLLAYKKKDYHQTITKLWAALGLIHQAQAAGNQKRRLAEIYGLLAIAYLRLNNLSWATNLFLASLDNLKDMPETARAPVLQFNKSAKFIKKLYKVDHTSYNELVQKSPILEIKRMRVT